MTRFIYRLTKYVCTDVGTNYNVNLWRTTKSYELNPVLVLFWDSDSEVRHRNT